MTRNCLRSQIHFKRAPSPRIRLVLISFVPTEEDDDAGDSNLEPISTDNIIQGRRTRNREINYAEEAAKSGEAMDDDDDDEDFKAPADDTEMKG